MLNFTMAIKKHKTTTIAQAQGHNERRHATASQLPRSAWFPTDKGAAVPAIVVVPWRQSRIDEARGMAKRKDAVVAVEYAIQVGTQSDWRETPTSENPHGKPKVQRPADMRKLVDGAIASIAKEYGRENVVSAALHLDESTPHVQIIVTPIRDGKLQAKYWTGGAEKCAKLRGRVHAEFSKYVPCQYAKGREGGKPLDESKRAGARPVPGLIDKLSGALEARRELEAARAREQAAFSAMRRTILAAEKKAAKAQAEAERVKQQAAEQAKKLVKEHTDQIRRLQGDQINAKAEVKRLASFENFDLKETLRKEQAARQQAEAQAAQAKIEAAKAANELAALKRQINPQKPKQKGMEL